MSEVEETAKAVQECSKTANNLLNKIASAVGYVFEVKKYEKEAQKSIIDEIANRIDINPIERMAIISNRNKIVKQFGNSIDIVNKAIEDLNVDAKSENMSDEWIQSFFDKAEKISDEEIQVVWGRVLANEANKPGSVPKSLLETLYIIDHDLANVFSKLCNYAVNDGNFPLIVLHENSEFFESIGINFTTLNELHRLGLIFFNSLGYASEIKDDGVISFTVKNKIYVVKTEYKKVDIGNVLFTKDGKALCKCIKQDIDDKVIEMAESHWKDSIEHEYIKLSEDQVIEVEVHREVEV